MAADNTRRAGITASPPLRTALDKHLSSGYNRFAAVYAADEERGCRRVKLDELVAALAAGDKGAFAELYEQTKKTVYYVALSVVRDRALAEDVMQTAYLNVIRHAGSFRAGTNAAAWIARIARNEALNLKKKRARETPLDGEDPAAFGSVETDDYGLLVDLARRTLPADEFTILMLAAAEGYKRREIAAILEMPLATVTWKYGRAIRAMRHALREKEGKDEDV